MSTERDLFLAKAEMRRRQEWASEERAARQARSEAQRREDVRDDERSEGESESGGAFSWLRRLAGAR